MPQDFLDPFIKYGPASCALSIAAIFCLWRFYKGKCIDYMDVFVVGTTSSSIPSGLVLIASAFEPSWLGKIADANIYVPFAGVALLFVVISTIKEKFNA